MPRRITATYLGVDYPLEIPGLDSRFIDGYIAGLSAAAQIVNKHPHPILYWRNESKAQTYHISGTSNVDVS